MILLSINCMFSGNEHFAVKKKTPTTIEPFFVDIKDILGINSVPNTDIKPETATSDSLSKTTADSIKNMFSRLDPTKVAANDYHQLPSNISMNSDAPHYKSPVNGKKLDKRYVGLDLNENKKMQNDIKNKIYDKNGKPIATDITLDGKLINAKKNRPIPVANSVANTITKSENVNAYNEMPVTGKNAKKKSLTGTTVVKSYNNMDLSNSTCVFYPENDKPPAGYEMVDMKFDYANVNTPFSLLCGNNNNMVEAKAVAVVRDGVVNNVSMLDMGSGYSGIPKVNVISKAGVGSGCILKPIVDDDGKIVAMDIVSGGSNYTIAPEINIEKQSGSKGCKLACKKN